MGLGGRIDFCAEVGSGRAGLGEVAGENRLEEGAKDNLSASSLRECHPEDEHKLECVVEGEPVHSADSTLKNSQEGKSYPICQPLSVIGLGGAEQGAQRIVTWVTDNKKR